MVCLGLAPQQRRRTKPVAPRNGTLRRRQLAFSLACAAIPGNQTLAKGRIFSESGQSASLLRRRSGMPGFGAAAAAPRQACGTPELNFPSAPTCFFHGWRRILALCRILAKPQQNPPQKSRHTSPAKSSLQNLHLPCKILHLFCGFFYAFFQLFTHFPARI